MVLSTNKFTEEVLRGKRFVQACHWDLHDPARPGRYADKSICQHDWLRRQHNTFYWKLCYQKFLFFSRLKRDLFFNFCVIIRKVKLWITQKIIVLLFICKICVILYCKVLNIFNFKLFNPPISFSKLELLLTHG